MMTLLYTFGVPLIVYLLITKNEKKLGLNGDKRILIAACILFTLSVFIPSPPIHGEDTEFVTHLLGGGIFTGLLWLYCRPILPVRSWWVDLLILFALVSMLGVVNELYELFVYEIGLTKEPLDDTSWDLAANTVGIALFYVSFRILKYLKSLSLQR